MKKTLIAIGLASFTLVACGGDDSPSTTTASTEAPTSTEAPQIANPASQYCIDQGGTLEIVDEQGGQVGYCNLPDGTRVEEWEFYQSGNG